MDRDYTPAGADILAVIHYTVDGTPHTVQVKEFPFRIGRDSSAVHLTLHDPKVSRTHAVLFFRDGGVWLYAAAGAVVVTCGAAALIYHKKRGARADR